MMSEDPWEVYNEGTKLQSSDSYKTHQNYQIPTLPDSDEN